LSLTSPFSISEFLAVLALFSGFGPTIPSNILVEVFSCCLPKSRKTWTMAWHCQLVQIWWFQVQAAWKHLN
jgi:hypothetical protein